MRYSVQRFIAVVVVILVMLIPVAMYAADFYRKRSEDLTLYDNRVASTTRELVGSDPVASITLSRSQVIVAVYQGDNFIIKRSDSDSVSQRRMQYPHIYPRFDLSVLNLERAGELLANDKTIKRIDIKATDNGPTVTAVRDYDESQSLTTDFSPA